MLSKHDELLVRDLRLQPLWLLWLYIVLGLLAVTLGLLQDSGVAKAACVGGGFLVALGAEKLVTRRIRNAALSVVRNRE